MKEYMFDKRTNEVFRSEKKLNDFRKLMNDMVAKQVCIIIFQLIR